MPNQHTPLEIETYYVRELHLKTNLDFDDTKPEDGELDVDFNVQLHPEDRLRFQISMSISIALDNQRLNEPYSLHMLINGFFRFKEGTPADIRSRMMFANAVPLLYGIARGCVGTVTGSAFHGPLLLPTYNFIEHLQRRSETREGAKGTHTVLPAGDAPHE